MREKCHIRKVDKGIVWCNASSYVGVILEVRSVRAEDAA